MKDECYQFIKNDFGKVEIVGFGSYGEVKLARNTQNNEIVAIKMVHLFSHRSTIRTQRSKLMFITNQIIPTSSNCKITIMSKTKTSLIWFYSMPREDLCTKRLNLVTVNSAKDSFAGISGTSAKLQGICTPNNSCTEI